MPKHDHLEALGGMNIMLNKTARAAVSEEYHQAFFDPFYPVIGAVSALVLICIVACIIYREHIDVDFVKYNSDKWATRENDREGRRRDPREKESLSAARARSSALMPLDFRRREERLDCRDSSCAIRSRCTCVALLSSVLSTATIRLSSR